MYNTLLVAMIGLPSVVLARNARFYDTDTCGEPEGGTKSKLYDMTKDNCIYEQGRLSFMPGERLGDGGGDFCFVYYDDNHCGCIAGSRLIHTSSAAYAIDCENKEVFGRKSYHFERATKDVGAAQQWCIQC